MTSHADSIVWAIATATARDATAPDYANQDRIAARLAEGRAKAQLSGSHPLSLSRAHSAGHAIAGVASHPARIGVDLERENAIGEAHARYFLTAREQIQVGRLSLTELWTLKEAAWKALGLDDTIPFTDLELLFDRDGCVHALRHGSMIVPVAVQLRAPWPGWVAAIVLIAGIGA